MAARPAVRLAVGGITDFPIDFDMDEGEDEAPESAHAHGPGPAPIGDTILDGIRDESSGIPAGDMGPLVYAVAK